MQKYYVFNKLILSMLGLSIISFNVIGTSKSSLDIKVGPNTPKGLDINKSSDLTQEAKPFKKPSQLIEINKKSRLTVDADFDYNSNRPVNINNNSVLTSDKN